MIEHDHHIIFMHDESCFAQISMGFVMTTLMNSDAGVGPWQVETETV